VHLSYLGYPIANDSQYGGTFKGPDQVRAHAAAAARLDLSSQSETAAMSSGLSASQIPPASATQTPWQESLTEAPNKRQRCESQAASNHTAPSDMSAVGASHRQLGDVQVQASVEMHSAHSGTGRPDPPTSISDANFLVPADLQDDMCLNCPQLIPPGYPMEIHPLWLHAQAYTSDRWAFVCSKPQWANSDWTPPLS